MDLSDSISGIENTIDKTGKIVIPTLPQPIKENLRWDTKNRSIRNFIDKQSGSLVQNVTEDTQRLIAKTISKSFDKAMTPDRVAAQIKDSIGLNERQSKALENYKSGLREKQVSDYKISILSSQYEDRLLDQRAIMIGRTEVSKAINFGQLSVWKSAADQGLLDKQTSKKSWQVDGKPCDDCIDLGDMEPISIDEFWDSNFGPVDAPPLHPNCECSLQLEFGDSEDKIQENTSDDEDLE